MLLLYARTIIPGVGVFARPAAPIRRSILLMPIIAAATRSHRERRRPPPYFSP